MIHWTPIVTSPSPGRGRVAGSDYLLPADSLTCKLSALELDEEDASLLSEEEEPLLVEELPLPARSRGVGIPTVAQLAVEALLQESVGMLGSLVLVYLPSLVL